MTQLIVIKLTRSEVDKPFLYKATVQKRSPSLLSLMVYVLGRFKKYME